MTRIIPPVLIGIATGAADVGSRLIEQQPVGATTAITIACFVGTACLWLANKFEQRDRREGERHDQIAADLARSNREFGERLASIERALKDLPCFNGKSKKPEQCE